MDMDWDIVDLMETERVESDIEKMKTEDQTSQANWKP